jgi:hypothetical protein
VKENKVMPAVSGEVYWREPKDHPPPRGVKMLILTDGGVAVIGDWMDDSNFTAWSPLPKRRPEDLKSRVFSALKKKSMTADQLSQELATPRSTVLVAINALKNNSMVCIQTYQKKAGALPVRVWGVGNVDAERPPYITAEQRNAAKRQKRKEQKEMNDKKFSPRRDVAASWF